MRKSGRLELTWTGKYEEKKIEPRILVEDKKKSYGNPANKNMLIHGDNLIALKALEADFTGKIKCVYIDPPFNTGQAFENYDDDMEHSIWLDLMARRLRLIYNLLEENGLLWVHLDDVEVHYCKVILDEIFMRRNFVSHITYERSAVAGIGQGGYLVNTTEHILLYKKGALPNKNNQSFEELGMNIMKRYNKYVSNFGTRKLIREFKSKSNGETVRVYKHIGFKIGSISLKNASKREREIRDEFAAHLDSLFRGNRVQRENEFQNDIIADFDKDVFYSIDYIPSRGKNEGRETTLYYYNCELLSWLKDTTSLNEEGILEKSTKMTTLWKHSEIPKADIANEGGVYFPRGKKPEQLLRRIIEMSTDPGDIVLDSFLGSGTTAAVAHKLGRQWIGIEMGEQAYTHCKKRLDYVIDGDDKLGISKAVNWQGGGGYHFYELAPSLLVKNDKLPVYQINPTYTFEMMCEAICKIEGFKYKPRDVFHGHSSEKRFIHVTTEFVNAAYIRSLSQHLEEGQSLLIYALKVQSDMMLPDNIEVKRIPKDLLDKCSFESEVR
ncbi:site-specific DNA-methyltransferase [Mitsuokella multacida]|jgi:adenine-specific DNA-methyltransferase|uniref:site-specific DNA-methyltransferase n=1 Tax=Mitsuokella multacida TaxID=52226 RepID=UPI00242E0A9E|nr:site-specific DNA-methyltransferase [Mitsuokella multacida]